MHAALLSANSFLRRSALLWLLQSVLCTPSGLHKLACMLACLLISVSVPEWLQLPRAAWLTKVTGACFAGGLLWARQSAW